MSAALPWQHSISECSSSNGASSGCSRLIMLLSVIKGSDGMWHQHQHQQQQRDLSLTPVMEPRTKHWIFWAERRDKHFKLIYACLRLDIRHARRLSPPAVINVRLKNGSEEAEKPKTRTLFLFTQLSLLTQTHPRGFSGVSVCCASSVGIRAQRSLARSANYITPVSIHNACSSHLQIKENPEENVFLRNT
eukprot:scaffold184587_cov66-Cyclotella_meneghiniana.AAC.4